MRTAQQVVSLSKAARRSIPHSILLTRWKPRGLSERATMDSLADAGLPLLEQTLGDLADFTKLSFSGVVPQSGRIAEQAHSLIAGLSAKGAIPTRSVGSEPG